MKKSNKMQLSIPEIKREGIHQYDFEFGNDLFKSFDYDEFNDAYLKVVVSKKNEHKKIELQIQIKGWVELHCDLSYDLFKLPVEIATTYLVKFDEVTKDQDDVISISSSETKLNLAIHLYECVLLSIPMKRIHPDIANGIRKKPNFADLDGLSIVDNSLGEKLKASDPRWDRLKKLVDNNKD